MTIIGRSMGFFTGGVVPVQIIKLAAQSGTFMVLYDDGTMKFTGLGPDDAFMNGGSGVDQAVLTVVPELSGVTDIAGLFATGIAKLSSGAVWAAGVDWSGEIGDGNNLSRDTYANVSTISSAAHVYGSYNNGYVVKTDGSLWACGYNQNYSIGQGSSPSNVLTYLSILTNVNQGIGKVAGNGLNTFGIRTDDSLWMVGNNTKGTAGNGTTTTITAFTRVLTTNVDKISAAAGGGQGFALALKKDRTVWAAGYNGQGQLGNGTTTDITTWAQVLTSVVQVACSGVDGSSNGKSYALKTNGTLWATGNNAFGELGTGNTTEIHTWAQVASNVAEVTAGQDWAAYRKTDGSLWVTGRNQIGALGFTPVPSTALVTGVKYSIWSPGNTVWTGVGSGFNTAQTEFVATGTAAGTGTAIPAVISWTQLSSATSSLPSTNVPPAAPGAVAASGSSNSITITLGPIVGATSYNIYWSNSPGVTIGTGTQITGVTSPYSHTGLTGDLTYYYIVTAVGTYGESVASNEVSASTTWVAKLNTTFWKAGSIVPPGAATWSGSQWDITVAIGVAAWLSTANAATWQLGYRPSHVRFTFTTDYNVQATLVDVYGNFIADTVSSVGSGTQTLTIAFKGGLSFDDIDQISFYAGPNQTTIALTNVEFKA